MGPKKWRPGAVIAKQLDDGSTYYGRLLPFPWAAFYHCRTNGNAKDLAAIIASPVLFTTAVTRRILSKGEWSIIGEIPLDGTLRRPAQCAIWEDRETCFIVTEDHRKVPATPAECEPLELAAVWAPEHIADRLQDAFAGRESKWVLEAKHRF